MSWTNPKTWAVGDVLTAADMNTYVRDNTNALGGTTPVYAARVTRVAAQTLAAAPVVLQIPYDTVVYDYSSSMTLGAAAHFTAPVAGLYDIRARQGNSLTSNPDEQQILIYINNVGSSIGTHQVWRGATAGDIVALTIADQFVLAAGDTIDVRVGHIQGGNITNLEQTSFLSYFAIRWL